MKNKTLILFFTLSTTVFSQTKKLDCDSIKKGVFDHNIYAKINGEYILKINANKNRVFLIRNLENNYFYYVSKQVMKKIEKCKCLGIKIENPINKNDKNAPKIIRD